MRKLLSRCHVRQECVVAACCSFNRPLSHRHQGSLVFLTKYAGRCSVSASRDLPKNFDPAEEEVIYGEWERAGYFRPEACRGDNPFTMVMPPPNVTGILHMGHAMFVTIQDIMGRFHRMRGRPVLYIPGTDHAGIATQMVVEKQLAGEGTTRQALGRDQFEERVWAWKNEKSGEIQNQLRRLGASCDWQREQFTLSEPLSGASHCHVHTTGSYG